VKKPLGKIFSQGVFIAPLPLRKPQGRQHLKLLPALWISRNFVKKEKKRGKYLFESVESIRIVFSIKGVTLVWGKVKNHLLGHSMRCFFIRHGMTGK